MIHKAEISKKNHETLQWLAPTCHLSPHHFLPSVLVLRYVGTSRWKQLRVNAMTTYGSNGGPSNRTVVLDRKCDSCSEL
ncbi:hypothetical protein FRX31_009796 [Thalictrum thalictroides]|uniref:Uncharacterized protein n=1 Tax=Thalictrum thalictroides TaxID=46969 RepID=A0A7J6WV65_THATH|nr:hypothetical protein FRX31_009796 [Thalictrum thalictroides]